MVTIVEPKRYITDIWGKPPIEFQATYRLMKYILQFDYCGDIFLHNVVTGQLVKLDKDEESALRLLPTTYFHKLKELVAGHFLVPIEYDEHQQVIKLRTILWKIHDVQSSKNITYYTIFPTTACNAQCWYCFERGVKPATMSNETVEDLVKFIVDHCGSEKITIRWFGGEPTIAAPQIDLICSGLRQNNIDFKSTITTNGLLLDEKMALKAKNDWNLKSAMISFDGAEFNYNNTKNYINAKGNPYRQVLKNIKGLLDHEIYVAVRMNFTKSNCEEFSKLLDDVQRTCSWSPYLQVYSHQVNENYNSVGEDSEALALDSWYSNKILELNNLSRSRGLYQNEKELPCLYFRMCEAASDNAVTITPQGNIVSCGEQIGDDQIKGNLKEGITNQELVRAWKQFVDFKRCDNCPLFPSCPSMLKCTGRDHCYRKLERISQYYTEMKRVVENSKDILIGGLNNGIPRAQS